MKNRGYFYLSLLLATMVGVGCTSQPSLHQHDSEASLATSYTYAGQERRALKALSAQEEEDWRLGKGMGLAKAAELNGYPGPMHSLEHASALKLTDAQRSQTLVLLNSHKTGVRALGEQLIQEERNLDLQFSAKSITPEHLNDLTEKIGITQAKIRADHLRTHLEQTALLTRTQVAQYNALRGYGRRS